MALEEVPWTTRGSRCSRAEMSCVEPWPAIELGIQLRVSADSAVVSKSSRWSQRATVLGERRPERPAAMDLEGEYAQLRGRSAPDRGDGGRHGRKHLDGGEAVHVGDLSWRPHESLPTLDGARRSGRGARERRRGESQAWDRAEAGHRR